MSPASAAPVRYDVVIPTTGRPTLATLLDALIAGSGPPPGRILVVDDRPQRSARLLGGPLHPRVEVLQGAGRGPGAARNAAWRASEAEWVAFLDDDVVTDPDWPARLAADLAGLPARTAASQGRIRVPLPAERRPTDWERNVAGLETALWATADMAYRRTALAAVGGFDERFPRAYREDADLGLRVTRAGWEIVRGARAVTHAVRPAGPLVSVRLQAGNADDVLMHALHGRRWRAAAGVPRGRRPLHLATTAAGLLAVAGLLGSGRAPAQRGRLAAHRGRLAAHRGRLGSSRGPLDGRRAGAVAAAGWLAGTAELAWARIAPGPRNPRELLTMLVTSVLIPPTASYHWAAGLLRVRRLLRDRTRAPRPRPDAVLLDRDGTLIVDVPYNGDPAKVVAMTGARDALDRLRAAGVALGVVSNQSGVARGLLTLERLDAVNRRVEELLGPLGPWAVCPHGPDDGCACRKPAPGLVLRAAAALGVDPARCAVVGDIGADVEAARAAGARPVLVPTPRTRPEELEAAPEVAPDLRAAVELLIGGRP